jgi:hypothetical protein
MPIPVYSLTESLIDIKKMFALPWKKDPGMMTQYFVEQGSAGFLGPYTQERRQIAAFGGGLLHACRPVTTGTPAC